MAFTDELEPEADRVWTAIVDHLMVRRLGAGTLDKAPFRHWVKQDYYYLREYARTFALAVASARDLDRMGAFAELLHSTLNTEMDLHRSYAAEFGIGEEELEATDPSPTTRAYTDFLVRTAAVEPFGHAVAAVLPCMWGFNETARRLADRGTPDHEQYEAWIEMYTGEEFEELTEWCRDLMDDVASAATSADRARYRERFLTSARYEYRFWDAAWRGETWELPETTG